MDNQQIQKLLTDASSSDIKEKPGNKLLCVADISCDIEGSLQFVDRVSTISKPFWYLSAEQNGTGTGEMSIIRSESDDHSNSVLVSSVDNLPAELPKDASDFFGAMLYPAMKDIIKELQTQKFDREASSLFAKNETLKSAMITEKGKLTAPFIRLQPLLDQVEEAAPNVDATDVVLSLESAANTKPEKLQKILLLGKGLVSGPVIAYFEGKPGYMMTVAAAAISSDSATAGKDQTNDTIGSNICYREYNLEKDAELLREWVQDHDIVIR